MKTNIVYWTVLVASTLAAAEVPSRETQIAVAVLAAPVELREGAAVLGYTPKGDLVTLRVGKNELICLASDPAKSSLSVACLPPGTGTVHGSRARTPGSESYGAAAQRRALEGDCGRETLAATRAPNALRAHGDRLRCRQWESEGFLPSMGNLRAFRDDPVYRPLN